MKPTQFYLETPVIQKLDTHLIINMDMAGVVATATSIATTLIIVNGDMLRQAMFSMFHSMTFNFPQSTD